ncbi:MAG: SGNH/GDSL hydrolase family protein [Flavobacteriales bacterium]
MKALRTILLPLLLPISLLHAQQTSVLFLGNSYTSVNDLPNTFRQLALSLGTEVEVTMYAPGGYTLEDHKFDPATRNLIASQPWDFVVLQEQSQLGAFPSMGQTAPQLAQLIEANNECTWPVLYMTWGRENGDAQSCVSYPFMCTYESMQQALRDNYLNTAVESNAFAAPVGVAWKHVRDDYPWIDLYQDDGSHPTVEGTYLAACVFYCTLFRQSCAGAYFQAGLPIATAVILRDVATATVLDSAETWNLNVPNGTDASFLVTNEPWTNDVTCHHPGQGMHEWTCTNGQIFSGPDVTFTFDDPGIFIITHIYADPCGNSDTATWFVEATPVGIVQGTMPGSCTVLAAGPAMIDATGRGILWVSDLQGRTILTQQLNGEQLRLTCPTGLHLWWIDDGTGLRSSGKILVP